MRTNLNRPVTILAALAAFLLTAFSVESARAQTEVARIPWYAKGAPVHSGFNTVRYFFPQVGASQRLEIQYVACGVRSSTGTPYEAYLGANDALSNARRRHLLIWSERDAGEVHYGISQPIVFTIKAGERPQIGYTYFTGGSMTYIPCTLSGELVFLQ